jgi:hypothetical protein
MGITGCIPRLVFLTQSRKVAEGRKENNRLNQGGTTDFTDGYGFLLQSRDFHPAVPKIPLVGEQRFQWVQ